MGQSGGEEQGGPITTSVLSGGGPRPEQSSPTAHPAPIQPPPPHTPGTGPKGIAAPKELDGARGRPGCMRGKAGQEAHTVSHPHTP